MKNLLLWLVETTRSEFLVAFIILPALAMSAACCYWPDRVTFPELSSEGYVLIVAWLFGSVALWWGRLELNDQIREQRKEGNSRL